jgi:AbrB family looped-hinge helix DNA binding protein
MPKKRQLKIRGKTTVGQRGQIVIPLELRRELHLKVGEQMFVFTRDNGTIVFMRAADMDQALHLI